MSNPLAVNPRFKLTADQRIKKRKAFLYVQNKGRRLSSSAFLIFVSPNRLQPTRIGITVSTKVDKRSNIRNRIKRLVRETFRNNQHIIKGAFDIVVVAKQSAKGISLHECRRQILGCLQQHGFLHTLT